MVDLRFIGRTIVCVGYSEQEGDIGEHEMRLSACICPNCDATHIVLRVDGDLHFNIPLPVEGIEALAEILHNPTPAREV